MDAVLINNSTSKCVRDFMLEDAVGRSFGKAKHWISDKHQVLKVGKKLSDMMPWISKGKLVDNARNQSPSHIFRRGFSLKVLQPISRFIQFPGLI